MAGGSPLLARVTPAPRRRLAPRAPLVAIACLLAGSLGASPPPLRLEAAIDVGSISVSGELEAGAEADELRASVLEALRGGMRSELVLELRLYERRSGIIGMLGDRLVDEAVVVRTTHRDPFEDALVLEERVDGVERAPAELADESELLDELFRVRLPGIMALPEKRGELYVAARYRLSPFELTAGLRIVALFFDVGVRTSGWSVVSWLGGDP